jgi:hypothetical protein
MGTILRLLAVAASTAALPAAEQTAAGAPLPAGWVLKASDHFGTGSSCNVGTFAQLHAKYREGQFYNTDAQGLVRIPNVVINHEQQTYVHFEDAVVFATDHLTIQGRGHSDRTITSAQLVSVHAARSWCVEARYRIPSADKSWPAFWQYACAKGNDLSEIDVEQPVTPNQGVHEVSLHNHPAATAISIVDRRFATKWMTFAGGTGFDASTAPLSYTSCYDDSARTITRFIDGKPIYSGSFTWNASLGGTGHGPDACTIVNLAVGGSWPGDLADPSAYHGDLELYSIDYYGPAGD